jgi:hypothetical protein
MCFSAEASIRSLLAGLTGSLLCISLGTTTDKIVGFFLGFVSLMQGIEYLLWRHQKCDNYNRFISVLGMVLNHLQPFILGLIVLLLNPKTANYRKIVTLMVFYLIVFIPYSYQFLKMKGTMCTIKGETNKDEHDYSQFCYTVFLFVMCAIFILGIPNKSTGLRFAAVATITYTTSLIFYPREVAGALWCYYTAYIPFIYYLF